MESRSSLSDSSVHLATSALADALPITSRQEGYLQRVMVVKCDYISRMSRRLASRVKAARGNDTTFGDTEMRNADQPRSAI